MGIPRISFILRLLLISAGLPPFRSSHFVNSQATGIVTEIDGRGFEAVAVINGDNHHLGLFETAEKAKEAVEQAQANYLAGIIRGAGGTKPTLTS